MSQKLRLCTVFLSLLMMIYMSITLTSGVNLGDNLLLALSAFGLSFWLVNALSNCIGLYVVRKQYERLKESESKNV